MPEPKPDERAFLTSALGGSAGCPDLAALAVAEPGSDLQRHLAVCSRCRTELAVFREFENAAPRPEPPK